MQKDAEGENINIAGVEGKFVLNGKEGGNMGLIPLWRQTPEQS
jgi:hypothetical protein